jgi:fluoroacetyl-CoA thioesterase
MARPVPIGTRAEVSYTVEFKHTLASHTAVLPPVLSTPWMIAWMEQACLVAQEPYCDEGEITVGTAVHIDHRAPATIGQRVIAHAILETIDGRFYIYRVAARNEQQQIGFGTVHRAVVNVANFMKKLQAEGQKSGV